ncbi:protein spaetzle 4-like [Phymastichus coffea]|uniref:protein spaetzle 4-like n=1 Tax=Phymastichus coffea TaxID=108790 RepID=UPI00273C3E3D|nr:protein spaetzle 4-like [Phymastichus coffea]
MLTIGAGLVVAEGGPSTFGYDASSACTQRVARAHIEKLPCDFSRDNWCSVAGNAYPWQAVRRFVQENQGLMRRMYGDEKHIDIFKSEFDKNDVELELADEHNHLYSGDLNPLFSQYQLDMEHELDQPITRRRSREYSSRASSVGAASKHDKPPNDLEKSTKDSSTLSTTFATTSTSLATTPHRTKMSPVPSSMTTGPSNATSSSSTTPIVMLAQIANIQNLSINEIHGQIDRLDANAEELTEIPLNETSSAPLENDHDDDLEDVYSAIDSVAEEDEDSQADESQQFRPRPEYRPPEAVRPENSNVGSVGTKQGQLFQDVANKDKQQESSVLKVRGINACAVKEEVVAPFWANNTRGEVLALLNMYPFEQYVHWEKCTHENKQMYCRDGCRCEQQYRLHRLLAYDPNNECRGIFSDWFKFPSCCICRCYDLPLEFRVTSRAPRASLAKRKLSVRAPQSPPITRQRVRH